MQQQLLNGDGVLVNLPGGDSDEMQVNPLRQHHRLIGTSRAFDASKRLLHSANTTQGDTGTFLMKPGKDSEVTLLFTICEEKVLFSGQ